ncbi:hypothetical protein [Priestia filamentosa]|uniref:hypothetical protein n=1 Tax=Priestia filamentosa TaxID=1402861 RepID=UPI002895B94F|nr:hypothetical protein [Priestia filamentosa]MDT3766397.1 hypothetical protein [Priestia filamentosa]
MRKLKLFFLLITILFTGCNIQDGQINNEESESSKEKNKTSENVQPIGTTLGMFDKDTALSKSNTTFELKNGDSFDPYISIHNRDQKENMFRIFFILDYKQSYVQYNKRQVNYIDVLLESNEKKKLDIKLDDLSNGLHDFVIFCIRRPDDLLTKQKFFPPGHFNIVKRTTLIVGDNQDYEKVNYKNLDVETTTNEIPLFVSKESRNTMRGEVSTLVNHNESPLWINFPTKSNNNYALLTFWGKELRNANFYHADNQGVANIPLNFKMKSDENLFVALVENPYTIVDEKSHSIPWDIQTTNRISVRE